MRVRRERVLALLDERRVGFPPGLEPRDPVDGRNNVRERRRGIICTTSQDGLVKFSQAAVDLYSETQADAYAASHDLGPDPYESLPLSDSPPSSPDPPSPGPAIEPSDPSCDPNYDGDCLDPNAFDYDCAGGTGNGSEYAGPVEVVGDDPYGLDADGDGFACE